MTDADSQPIQITRLADTKPYKKNTKVVLAVDLPHVPEGTKGKVKLINGMTWLRYWVQFDNGVWLSNIDHGHLVPAGEWEDFKRRRAEQADAPDSGAGPEAPAAADAGGGEAAAGAASGIPAHLLERSKKARERAAAKG